MKSEPMPKEQYFDRLGELADAMIRDYGKDFAMGALLITARCVAQANGSADDASSQDPGGSVILTAGQSGFNK